MRLGAGGQNEQAVPVWVRDDGRRAGQAVALDAERRTR